MVTPAWEEVERWKNYWQSFLKAVMGVGVGGEGEVGEGEGP